MQLSYKLNLKRTLRFLVIPATALIMASCGGGGGTHTLEYEEKLDPTKGIITDLEEVSKDQFKIINERLVESPDSSLVIAHFIDGKIDTFNLDEVTVSKNATSTTSTRTGGMNSVLMGGMMGYWMGRSMSSPLNRSSYRNDAAYTRSSSSTNTSFRSSAKSTRVSKPSSGKSGFGSGKSSRSYGG